MTAPANERTDIGRAADPGDAADQSKTERLYHHLRRLIRETKLLPGTHIQKDEVAAELGVSLAPVSQALSWLAEDMLVDIRPRHGSFVAPIRAHDLRESMFLRKALEVEAVRLIAAQPDQQLLDDLKQNFEQQCQALREGDIYRLSDLDSIFHSTLMLATDFRRGNHEASPQAGLAIPGSSAGADRSCRSRWRLDQPLSGKLNRWMHGKGL